jgi:hypothetical protein
MIEVKEYNDQMSKELMLFRRTALKEGNDSLSSDKFNPFSLNGKIWCVYINDELASISVVEASHYTGDPKTAARVCRYHILKKFRHSHCGFRMLPYQIEWAKSQKYKILYWTHNVKNRALNALYQHQKKMIDPESKVFFDSSWYKQVKHDKRFLFQIDSNSDFLQNVYYINLDDKNYIWHPKKSVLWI